MKLAKLFLIIIGTLALIGVGSIAVSHFLSKEAIAPVDSVPTNITLSGTYVCLPYLNKTKTAPEECVFGLLTDDGVYYMVNFGQSAGAMEEFQKGAHIVADGFFMYKESLSTDQWQNYNMKGIFTITKKITSTEPIPTPKPVPKPVACTEEAKLCPDGSYVSRTGTKCEFTPCPEVKPPLAICDYAAPPQGCNYVAGPNYNAQTMCGMVLRCPHESEILLKEGERRGSLLLQKIHPEYITGLNFREYPIATEQGQPITLQFGETASNGCTVSLTLKKITGDTAIFSEEIDNNKICPICLAKDTLIDTQQGSVPVQDIKVGMLVWSETQAGARVLEPVVKISKTVVPLNHEVVDLTLDDGRRLQASPLHPTTDGRTVGDLIEGDFFDGSKIISANHAAYGFDATYDLLPAGDTGAYWANGVLLGSTLNISRLK